MCHTPEQSKTPGRQTNQRFFVDQPEAAENNKLVELIEQNAGLLEE